MTLSVKVLFGNHSQPHARKEEVQYHNTIRTALEAAGITTGSFRLRLGARYRGLDIGKNGGIAISRPPSDEEHWVTLFIQPSDTSSTFHGRLYPLDKAVSARELYALLLEPADETTTGILHSITDCIKEKIEVDETRQRMVPPKTANLNPASYTQGRFAEVFETPSVTRELTLWCGENDAVPCPETFRTNVERGMTERDFAAKMRRVFSNALFDLGEYDQILKLAQTGLKKGSRGKTVDKFLTQVLQTSYCISVARKLGLIEEVSGRIFLTIKVVDSINEVEEGSFVAENVTVHELAMSVYLQNVLTLQRERLKCAQMRKQIEEYEHDLGVLTAEIAKLTARRCAAVEKRVAIERDLKPITEAIAAKERAIEEIREAAFAASYSIIDEEK